MQLKIRALELNSLKIAFLIFPLSPFPHHLETTTIREQSRVTMMGYSWSRSIKAVAPLVAVIWAPMLLGLVELLTIQLENFLKIYPALGVDRRERR